MPLPPRKESQTPGLPADLDPKQVAPSVLVQRLITRGRLPHAVIDYPRFDDAGIPVTKVHLRLLTVAEMDRALANARLYVERLLSNGKKENGLDWRPEELEHNARVEEILAIACREPDDPSQAFFGYGINSVREHCTAEELGILANAYGNLSAQRPHLDSMSEADMEKALRAIEEGAQQFPFYFFSREQLETLLGFAARRWVEAESSSTGQKPTSSSG